MGSALKHKVFRALKQGDVLNKIKKEAKYFVWFAGDNNFKKATASGNSYEMVERPGEVIYVPVALINHRLSPKVKNIYNHKYKFDFQNITVKGSKERVQGMILGGNWDLDKQGFENYNEFIGFKERFIEGKGWEETIFYRVFDKRRQDNYRMAQCEDFNEFKEKHLLRWDKLYDEIYKNGYKSQNDLNGNNADEVQVCVSRYGDLIFRDGKHRFFIAKFLGVSEVPVIVNVWHKAIIEEAMSVTGSEKVTPSLLLDYILSKKAITADI